MTKRNLPQLYFSESVKILGILLEQLKRLGFNYLGILTLNSLLCFVLAL